MKKLYVSSDPSYPSLPDLRLYSIVTYTQPTSKSNAGCVRKRGILTTQDGLHVEVLDLRAHVWGVEQDLSKVVKNGAYGVAGWITPANRNYQY